ncbi:hypothetical protein A3H09_00390 [Candidatus Falkowbacteria bacterium RIFCSPLOWO2_12_FULL_45_13]|uniref:HTH marR-type domain-containing protein n=2 Tax=Candidatus Falkowiibacteriota TaxID=1752728 RepID=A0A1F5SBL3_9BACT|nr:MAG: hypothetical protein A3H66_02725 [Candidatus Falkowbacteria bacterium RIFCSPLOWO2_02_FULL_45_21]OGF30720.1 MAG: hypothetical protein A3H09_00390 [Candidatus Falkowbacteria bacterium RIFCSPLOWO2_12_FULL_45_13]
MRLSKLQKYILERCYNYKSSGPEDFYDFYGEKIKSKKLVQDVIHKSLDSLVSKDLLAAMGKKTARKWFIHRVKLTNLGKKLAIKMIKNRQRKLPIK